MCTAGALLLRGKQTFALKHQSNFFERRSNISFRKSYLSQPFDIAELATTLFDEYNRFCKSEPPLKKSRLVDDVHSCLNLAVCRFVLCSQNNECDGGCVQHLGEPGDIRNASYWDAIELIPRQAKTNLHKIFQLAPFARPTMPEEYICADQVISSLFATFAFEVRRCFLTYFRCVLTDLKRKAKRGYFREYLHMRRRSVTLPERYH